MLAKIELVSNRLSELGINHENEFSQNTLMQQVAYIDHLNHAAYRAIEESYSRFNPDSQKDEQLRFYKNIIMIKNVLRELQVIHTEITSILVQNSEIYIHDEREIVLNNKYVLPQFINDSPKEIVRGNFYQLLENISKNNSLSKEEFNYINSLIMQIASRPEGIKLIVKLNYLLSIKNAKLILKPSDSFQCSMIQSGLAKINPSYTGSSIKPNEDFKTVFKRETVPGIGSDAIQIGVNYLHNDSISALSLEAYASSGSGLTDIGPPFILLAHELIHGLHNLTGKARYNFRPFFQAQKYAKDPFMTKLYTTSSLYSYGSAAEEYWTIEGGVLCENTIRKEHGFLNRTGHISAEAGNQAIRDLYYIGLACSYKEAHLEAYQKYLEKLNIMNEQDWEGISEADLSVESFLRLEKFKSLSYSLTDLINLSKNIGTIQLKKMGNIIDELKNPPEGVNSEIILEEFLLSMPPKIAQVFIGVSKANMMDYTEIDLAHLNEALPKIKKIDETLQNSGFPDSFLKSFKEFTENLESVSKASYKL